MADGINPEQSVRIPIEERFVSISVTAIGDHATGVVVYYAAIDRAGAAWWWDTKQPTDEWQPLPPHPGPLTSGSVP